jgi:hypothetical protein
VAVDCVLEDERGYELARAEDPTGELNRLVPSYQDEHFQCWRFIDEYGDSVFNRLQMPQFLRELDLIRATSAAPAPLKVLEQIEALATRCRDEVHLYLKFYGD